MPLPLSLPSARHLALTWGIAAPFGGLTTALLDRSRIFAEAGHPVDIVTFDDRARETGLDLEALAAAGVRVRNLYDAVRAGELGAAGTPSDVAPLPPAAAANDVVEDVVAGELVRRVRFDDAGKPADIDHLRTDGTIALSERRSGSVGGRRGRILIARDEAGTPIRQWRRRYDLYADWLDAVTAGERTFLIVDSKAVALFVADYRRRHVTTVHVIHGSHRGTDPGSIRPSRQAAFERLDAFGAVAFATRSQRDDVRALVGRAPNLVTVAHPIAPGAPLDPAAPRSGAVVIARLERIKRVDDAIAAVGRANAAGADIDLDVYGAGTQAAALADAAAGMRGIRLHGHTDHPDAVLRSARWLLLTSRSEAFGLVLVEAMAAGCLPIAYDVPYGPADLIRNGENGWLVPAGDIDALADALRAASALPPERIAAMQRAARRTAEEYSADRVRRRWAEVLRSARTHRGLRTAALPLARAVTRRARAALRRARAVLRRARAVARRLRNPGR